MEKQRKAKAEAEQRKKFEAEAVEKWKIAEAEKAAKEKKEKEEAEEEMRHKMRDRLLASGMPQNQIEAILAGKRVAPGMPGHGMPGHGMPGHGMPGPGMPGPGMPRPGMFPHPPPPPPAPMPGQMQLMHGPGYNTEMTTSKETYTRMARRHLSIEALRSKAIEYELDTVRLLLLLWPPCLLCPSLFLALHILTATVCRIPSISLSSAGYRPRSRRSCGR